MSGKKTLSSLPHSMSRVSPEKEGREGGMDCTVEDGMLIFSLTSSAATRAA